MANSKEIPVVRASNETLPYPLDIAPPSADKLIRMNEKAAKEAQKRIEEYDRSKLPFWKRFF